MREFDSYFCAFVFGVICAITAGPVVDSCEARKKASHTLFAVGDESPSTGSSVIVLNAVNDSVCNLQCAVGYYHYPLGSNANSKNSSRKCGTGNRKTDQILRK